MAIVTVLWSTIIVDVVTVTVVVPLVVIRVVVTPTRSTGSRVVVDIAVTTEKVLYVVDGSLPCDGIPLV